MVGRRRSTQDQVNAVTKSIRQADINFNSNIKRTNPLWFVNQIEEMANQELVGDEAIKSVFKAALKGDAANWVRFADEGEYPQLRRRFLDKYWSETIQREVNAYLRSGSYEGDGGRETYFLK